MTRSLIVEGACGCCCPSSNSTTGPWVGVAAASWTSRTRVPGSEYWKSAQSFGLPDIFVPVAVRHYARHYATQGITYRDVWDGPGFDTASDSGKAELANLGRAPVGNRPVQPDAAIVEPLAQAGHLARPTICDLETGYSARNADEWDRFISAMGAFDLVETNAQHVTRALQVQRLLASRSQRERIIPDLLVQQ